MREISCQEVLGHIEAFLDFELAKDACSLVTVHLQRCGDCNDHAYFARQVRDIVAKKCASSPPAELERRIRASLLSEPAAHPGTAERPPGPAEPGPAEPPPGPAEPPPPGPA